MTLKVASLYGFVPLPDYRDLRAPLLVLCEALTLKGTILLAPEGLNGTIAGAAAAIDACVEAIMDGPLFAGRLHALNVRLSPASAMPFGRLKVRLRREIVTLSAPCDPTRRVGTYVDPSDWNALLEEPDLVLIDTRNAFEVAMGSFAGAVDPGLRRFGDFPAFAGRDLDPRRDKTIAMFCTGGIRCEKASAYLLGQGFETVYHLKGGILTYLDMVPKAESRWSGSCFVFDQRIALGHGLQPVAPAPDIDDV